MSQVLTNATELSRPVDGQDNNTWGPLIEGIIDWLDRAVGGRANIDVTSADATLSTSEGQMKTISVFGSPAADRNVVFPVKNRAYFVRNGTGRTLSIHVNGSPANKVYIPNTTAVWVVTNTTGETRCASRPTTPSGASPNEVTWPVELTGQVATYVGPGMAFEDRLVGWARRAAGVLGLGLIYNGDSIRFNATNTAAAPLIGLANAALNAWTSGFYRSSDAVAWTRLGVHQGLLGNGVVVGSPTGGELGVGSVNVAGLIYRQGVEVPFQRTVLVASIAVTAGSGGSTAHGLSGAPTLIVGHVRATAANNGYAIGARVDCRSAGSQVLLAGDDTNAIYRVGGGGIQIPHPTSGIPFVASSSQWVLDITAYR